MTEKEAFDLFIEKGFTYNPETGEIKTHMGKDITPTNYRNKMYIRCSIKYNSQTINVGGHRLAWYMTYGEIPNIIDHIDGDSLNNRITNLRNVDQTKNCWNRKNNNHSEPIKGYYWRKDRNKWKSHIVVNGKSITLGHFDNEEDAHKAYLEGKEKYHLFDVSEIPSPEPKKSNGYSIRKGDGKYRARITVNKKYIHLGYFNSKAEAHQAYLDAKKIYHIV